MHYKLTASSDQIQLKEQPKSEKMNILIDQKVLNYSMSSNDSESSPVSHLSEKNIRKVDPDSIPKITRRLQRTITWPGGAKYVGEFLNNEEVGKGAFFEPNGVIYEGFFLNGVFTEETITLPDNKGKFVGIFVDGTGHGTFFEADGGIYKGDVVGFQFHGKGEFICPDKKVYVGDYVEGKRTGYGILKWPNGDEYKGQFWKNKPLMGRSHKNLQKNF
ncbi:MAG: hypothetical protein H0T62_14580 [Parachlamydiaceae bacterium]|nr:hypothetical protein [Parachlamydiaceae bacterium]